MYAMNDGTVFHEPVFVGIVRPRMFGKYRIMADRNGVLNEYTYKNINRTSLIIGDEVTWCVCAALIEDILFIELNIN